MITSTSTLDVSNTYDPGRFSGESLTGYSRESSGALPVLDSEKKEEVSADDLKKLVIKIIAEKSLDNPFPHKINPHAQEVNKITIEWVERFKLISDEVEFKKFIKAKFIDLTAGAYPDCDLNMLVLAHKVVAWLYVEDDIFEKRGSKEIEAFIKRTVKLLNGKSTLKENDEPLIQAIYDLTKDIRVVAKKTSFERFFKALHNHLKSTVWEAKNREKGIKIPDYKTYREKRIDTSGYLVTAAMIEVTGRMDISNKIFDKYLNERTILSGRIVCDLNDIQSSPKELAQNSLNNVVFVIKQSLGAECTLEKAFMLSVNLHNDEVQEFEKSVTYLKDWMQSQDCDPKLKKLEHDVSNYVEGIRFWEGSHFVFSAKSDRYMGIKRVLSSLN